MADKRRGGKKGGGDKPKEAEHSGTERGQETD